MKWGVRKVHIHRQCHFCHVPRAASEMLYCLDTEDTREVVVACADCFHTLAQATAVAAASNPGAVVLEELASSWENIA